MTVNFKNYKERFPLVELPITLSEDSHHDFSTENDPLQTEMIKEYITRYEAVEIDDELTEYMACFQVPLDKKEFIALVYWKAALLTYDYVLATYNPKTGDMIDKKAIAGTKVVDNGVKRIAAIIKEDLSVFVAEGVAEDGKEYDADASKVRRFQILDSGLIEQEF
jgi:hypothetical protein